MDIQVLSKLELALERAIYKKSLYEFYKVAFCQLHPGVDYDENWHAKYICDILQAEFERILRKEVRTKDIIINVPFRSSKSVLTTIVFPVWCWTIEPAMKFISVSYSGTLALEHSRRSRDLILSVWFQRLYSHKIKLKADVSAVSHYETTATGMRKAVGTGGQITGSGADIIIVDDPQDPKKAASEVERQNTIEFYDHTLFSRLNDPDVGVRIIIQQRLHEQDLTGHLMDKKQGRPDDHQHICIPGELDMSILSPKSLEKYYKDGLFWPTRFSKKILAAYKKALGLLQYAGQVGQRPVPPEGNLFKRKWFDIIEPEMIARNLSEHPIHFFVDTAYTEDETERNDPSGILSVFFKDNIIYVVNFTEVWLEFPQLIDFLKEYAKSFGYSSHSGIFVEPKASGKSVVQQLKAGTQLNVMEIEGEYLKDDKVTRANGVSPIAMARRIKLINGPYVDQYLNQLTSFPKASHDEAVDVTVYAANYLIPINDFLSAFL
jgi:predicted phage terminase large subunit-like protein